MMIIAILVGSLSTYVGLLMSYWFDLAASATIVLVAVAFFFAALAVTNVRAPGQAEGETDPTTGETVA
jgi:manganese/iron transport system permease protein